MFNISDRVHIDISLNSIDAETVVLGVILCLYIDRYTYRQRDRKIDRYTYQLWRKVDQLVKKNKNKTQENFSLSLSLYIYIYTDRK